jgi:hypothetical protein
MMPVRSLSAAALLVAVAVASSFGPVRSGQGDRAIQLAQSDTIGGTVGQGSKDLSGRPATPPPPSTPPPAQTKKPATPQAPSFANCVRLDITVDRLDFDNVPWDPFQGNVGNPDIQLTEVNTGFVSQECGNTFSCSVTIQRPPNPLNLRIVDVDVDPDDLIGQGSCSLSRTSCRIGKASIRLRSC